MVQVLRFIKGKRATDAGADEYAAGEVATPGDEVYRIVVRAIGVLQCAADLFQVLMSKCLVR